MALIVQKYGGTSLATPAQIKSVSHRVAALYRQGKKVIVVVSAMGKTTDNLSALAYQVSRRPNRRELDMLLSTGERVASAMVSLAINDLGIPAISFTGSQAGILTDDSHTNARIVEVKPIRIEHELLQRRIVVIAGFQGVSPFSKEITTLGRGGTDLTAVALAQHFHSEKCEILKDVDGVFSADPKVVPGAHRIPRLSFECLREMTFWGAKMIHHRAAELTSRLKVPLFVGMAHAEGEGTQIADLGQEGEMLEEMKVLTVNSHSRVFKIAMAGKSHAESYKNLEKVLEGAGLPWPQILDSTYSGSSATFLVTAPTEILEAIESLQSDTNLKILNNSLASVTATCAGAIASPLIAQLTQAVETQKISAQHVLLSPMSATFVVAARDREETIRALHG